LENKDEFLGEYKYEIREGFGIYKFILETIKIIGKQDKDYI
jgi:hypothetical protein